MIIRTNLSIQTLIQFSYDEISVTLVFHKIFHTIDFEPTDAVTCQSLIYNLKKILKTKISKL